ncbi:acyl-CoA synthetase [Panus rudis PR-1116 ss-1]|nr:acyl-CoA synthetase [Panus rudis PR-1116 ss-1]
MSLLRLRTPPKPKILYRDAVVASQTNARRALTVSSVVGPTEPPLVQSTLSHYFENEILKHHSTRPALICRAEHPRAHGGPVSRNLGVTRHLAWDFEEFDRHIEALARGLLDLGVKKGDRVGVVMGNNSAYAMLQWACASIGAILVTLNPAYRLPELVKTLSLVGVSHLFVVPRIRTSEYVKMLGDAFPSLKNSAPGEIQEEALPDLKHLVVVDTSGDLKQFQRDIEDTRPAVDFREVLVWREDGSEDRRVKEIGQSLHYEDVINLQFTSGTTGAPKAVSLSHYNLLNNGLNIGRCMRLTPSDKLCNVPPLFHCFGLVLGNLAAWSHGACIVYASQIFDPPRIVDAVLDERCTALHGVPTHFMGVLAEVEKRKEMGERLDFSSLRTGIAAGSPVPIELMRKLIEKLNLMELTNAYGMTETSPVTFQTTPDDPVINRVETVGKVHPHVRAKVVDLEGHVVPVGTPGELLVTGYVLQKGYWNDEEQTKKVMIPDEEGTIWMHTGDEAIMDKDGYLRNCVATIETDSLVAVVGRIKDIIIRGGENLFPVQIENVLTAHPHIREAAAVAVPDMKYGEVVGAWVLKDPNSKLTRAEVRQTVAENMNPQNAPAWVWFLGEDGVPDELPKTASGKVQKHVLRNWSKELSKKGLGSSTSLKA